jgi:endo-1,4-beta-D-glucanase Y
MNVGGEWVAWMFPMPKRFSPQCAARATLLTALLVVSGLACAPPGRTGTEPTSGSGAGSGTSGGITGSGGATTGSGGSGGRLSGAGGTVGTGAGGAGNVVGTGNGGIGSAGTGNSAGRGSGGRGNSSGTGGSGAAGTTGLSRGPTPPMNGANFPFPQNRQLSGCINPTGYDNNDVLAAYTQWKTDLVTSNGAGTFQRVQRTSSDGVSASTPLNSTVSEGIGYGMLIAVYMGDPASHTLFDNLWKYEQLHLDDNKLMNWSIDASGNVSGNNQGNGGATDADEDMAWALVMADKQWGSAGALNYASLATAQITAIWNHEIYNSNLAGPGDSWGPTNLYQDINISYFAPAYYRVFKTLDSGHAWEAVTQTVFDTIDLALSGNGNATNGLVPAWCGTTSSSCVSSGAGPFNYQYDSCRTPFRVGIDWCWNGSRLSSAAAAINPTRAQSYVAKTSSFFSGVGAASIVDGYNLDGTPASGVHTAAQGQSAAFLGPAGVGAMSSASYQAFLDAAYSRLKTRQLTIGGAYYDESWTVMSLLMMTGNFLDYTAISPAQ